MQTNSNPFADRMMTDGSIPTVDPADLKSVWQMQEGVFRSHPGQHLAVGFDLYERACTAGANVHAVFLRISMLRMIQMLVESERLIFPWLHEGKPDDVVFKVLAALPMTGLPTSPSNGFPFDMEEFRKLIEMESQTQRNDRTTNGLRNRRLASYNCAARSSSAMSNFFIFSIACMA